MWRNASIVNSTITSREIVEDLQFAKNARKFINLEIALFSQIVLSATRATWSNMNFVRKDISKECKKNQNEEKNEQTCSIIHEARENKTNWDFFVLFFDRLRFFFYFFHFFHVFLFRRIFVDNYFVANEQSFRSSSVTLLDWANVAQKCSTFVTKTFQIIKTSRKRTLIFSTILQQQNVSNINQKVIKMKKTMMTFSMYSQKKKKRFVYVSLSIKIDAKILTHEFIKNVVFDFISQILVTMNELASNSFDKNMMIKTMKSLSTRTSRSRVKFFRSRKNRFWNNSKAQIWRNWLNSKIMKSKNMRVTFKKNSIDRFRKLTKNKNDAKLTNVKTKQLWRTTTRCSFCNITYKTNANRQWFRYWQILECEILTLLRFKNREWIRKTGRRWTRFIRTFIYCFVLRWIREFVFTSMNILNWKIEKWNIHQRTFACWNSRHNSNRIRKWMKNNWSMCIICTIRCRCRLFRWTVCSFCLLSTCSWRNLIIMFCWKISIFIICFVENRQNLHNTLRQIFCWTSSKRTNSFWRCWWAHLFERLAINLTR